MKHTIHYAFAEVFQVPLVDIQHQVDLSDIEQACLHDYRNRGTFLVAIDCDRTNQRSNIVGCGGIKKFDKTTCELKRLAVSPSHQGSGLGRRLATVLIEFARVSGYQQLRLDIVNPHKQAAAINLYNSLGFYSINRYNSNPHAKVFLENHL